MVKDIDTGSAASWPSQLTNVNGTLFFTANSTTAGQELWKSDGTAAGTALVKTFSPGWIENLTPVQGTLFFSANDGTHATELWRSDGTATGTTLVKDINPGGSYLNQDGGSYPKGLTVVNETLFFSASDGTNGTELWKSDGTATGTTLVKDIYPGGYWVPGGSYYYGYYYTFVPNSSSPGNLTNANGMLYFTATDGQSGGELWQSDGTEDGTVLVSDINPGSASSSPRNLTNVNDTLYFTASESAHGEEPWLLAPDSNGPTLEVSGFPATITAGVAGTFTVTATNADGTTDTSYLGTVHFASSDPQAVLPSGYTFTAADHGVHTFDATLKTAGSQSITSRDSVVPGGAGTQSGISVSAAAASRFTVAGFPLPVTAGVAGNVSVIALDPYGNRATGYAGTVHFTSSDAKAVLPGNYTFTAADAGTHAFSATLKTAGYQSLTATDAANAAITGTLGSILVNPAAASRLLLSAPASVVAGAKFSMTVTVVDAYGNVVTGYRGTITFRSSDPASRLPKNYTFTAGDQGVHTFTGLVLKKKGSQSITVTDALNSSVSGSVLINVV
jgi:ELWxxDGT repeat protein